ncbi:MAG: alkylmercury lyase family protein [Deltaproteobacteria bacterium]|nr:alkylmercury lyase family protein [Deltaproteobacteria bacterium]
MAVSWLFPGKKVRIDSPCLDCGKPITIDMCDGVIEKVDPEGVIGHVSLPVSKWMTDIPYA